MGDHASWWRIHEIRRFRDRKDTMTTRLPEVGRLVRLHSLFEDGQINAIVVWIPSEDEVREKWKKLSPESMRDPEICFRVLTQEGEEEYWTEWEWNYIDNEDEEK